MAEGKGLFKRFLRWFRGDDLDEYLLEDKRPMLSAEVKEGISGAEAAALAGTATAVIDEPLDEDDWPLRRTFIDERDGDDGRTSTPETVDEAYVLAREEGKPQGEKETDSTDQLGGDSEGVSLSRVSPPEEEPSPEEVALAKVEEGVGEVTRLLGDISTAVLQQNETVEGLVKTMGEMPAAVRAQGVYLETITRQLEAQNARSAELAARLKDLPTVLRDLPEQGRTQLEFLRRIADSLETHSQRHDTLLQHLADTHSTLQSIGENTRTQARLLQEIDRSQKTILEVVTESAEAGTKRYAWLMCLMWAVTVVTAGGIAFVVYWLTRHLPAG